MDFEALAASLSLDKIMCANCWNFLSYFPIYITPDNSNICGRCPKQDSLKRMEAYEALAQFVSFPCRYKDEGCSETLLPKDMPKHEQQCLYRIINCPIKCEWEGPFLSLQEHCLTDHQDLLLSEGDFEVELSNSSNTENFLDKGHTVFLVTSKFDFDSNVFECAIADLKGSKKYSCEISLKCEKRTFSVEIETTSIFEDKKFTQISLQSIRDSTNSSLFGKIVIADIAADNTDLNYKDNMQLLSVIKCGVCAHYVIPPILQYNDSSLLCSKCAIVNKVTMPTNQNITLNKIASLLNYPCRYRKDGCTFVSKPDQIPGHQEFCKYRRCQCPLKYSATSCDWIGFEKDIIAHLQEHHQDRALGSKEISASISKHEKNYFKLMASSNCLFKFHCFKTKANQLAYRMKLMAGNFHEDDFVYELEIIDQNQQGRKLLIRQMMSAQQVHYIRKSQLKRLSKNDNVAFRVRIFKRM